MCKCVCVCVYHRESASECLGGCSRTIADEFSLRPLILRKVMSVEKVAHEGGAGAPEDGPQAVDPAHGLNHIY